MITASSPPLPTVPETPPALFLLGQPCIRCAGAPDFHLERRDAALLARLVLQGPMARPLAAQWLWESVAPAQAQASLRQRLFRLRRAVGFNLLQSTALLRLAPGLVHDLVIPAGGLASAGGAGGPSPESDLLGGLDYSGCGALSEWVDAARAQWQLRQSSACLQAIDGLTDAGRFTEALGLARRVLIDEPTSELAHCRVMRLHYLQGDRAAALSAFDACRVALKTNLGVAPAAATLELARQIQAIAIPRSPGPKPRPLSLLRPPQLVGRAAAWARLVEAAAACRPLRVVGEAGIGKSRLLADFVASQEGWVLVDARPGDVAQPLALLSRLVEGLLARFGAPNVACPTESVANHVGELARLAPSLGPAPAQPYNPLRLQQAVAAALAQWRTRGLAGIVVDDLQFADAVSLDLLAPRLVPREGLGWVLAGRPGGREVGQPGAAPTFTSEWETLTLEPLVLDEAVALVDSLVLPDVFGAEWAAHLMRRGGGNPWFLLQFLAHALERGVQPPTDASGDLAAPADLLSPMLARLGELSAPARGLARLAAAAGASFTVELAAEVLNRHALDLADAWSELEAAQVIRAGGFVHDLMREAAEQSTPAEVTRVLHRDVARARVALGHAPAAVALHWDRAQAWPEAAAAYEVAALVAQQHAAVAEEWLALEAAARCHRAGASSDAPAAAFACEIRAVKLMLSSLAVERAAELSLKLVERAEYPGQHAAALEARAHVLLELQRGPEALATAQAAVLAADTACDVRLAVLARQRAAMAWVRLGHHDEALAQARAAVPGLDALAVHERLAWWIDQAVILDHADHRSEAVLALEHARVEGSAAGRWSVVADALSSRSIALMHLGRQAEATQDLVDSMAAGRQAGLEDTALLLDEMSLVGHWRDAGRFGDYLERAESLPQALRETGHKFWAANAEHDLGVAYAWLGRPDLAWRMLMPLPEDLHPTMRAMRLMTQARMAREMDLPVPKSPAALVAEAVDLIQASGDTGRSHVRLRIALESARDLPPDLGAARAAAIEAEALARENLMLAASASMLRLQFAVQGGEDSQAAAVARALLDRCDPHGPPGGIYPPDLWWWVAQGLKVQQPALANRVLDRAVRWVRSTAATQVPALFRQSFQRRNPRNVALLAMRPA